MQRRLQIYLLLVWQVHFPSDYHNQYSTYSPQFILLRVAQNLGQIVSLRATGAILPQHVLLYLTRFLRFLIDQKFLHIWHYASADVETP